ncbi:MAG: hypothetical protein HQ518_12550, partial [Rhodopirellula sp.]|nr:hypothetical protein [Rhodopirellula sp.]
MEYDTTLLDLTAGDVTLGAAAVDFSSPFVNVNDAIGRVSVNSFATNALGTGSGGLIVLNFSSVSGQNGTSPVTFTQNANTGLNEGELVATFTGGSVAVNAPVIPDLTVNIVNSTLNAANSSSVVTFVFDGNVTGFEVSDVTVSGGVLSNFAGTGSTFSAVFTANDEFAGTGSVGVATASYTNSDNEPGTGGSDTVAIDTNSASPEFAFGFEAIASDIHPTLRYFGSPNAGQAPFQIIRYGEIKLSSLTGLPATLAAAGNDPANIVIRVGSDDPTNPVEVISLDSFNDGLSSGTVNQTYRPNGSLAPGGTQTDVPTATVFVSGVAVAEGVFQELSLDGNMDGDILSSSTGRILLERVLGDDTTVFDEFLAKNGSGLIEFTLDQFFFTAPPTGFGDSERFTSTGASPDGDPNQAPSVGTNSPLVVLEGASGTITMALLNEADPDDSGFGVTYTVTSGPSFGTLDLSGSPTTVFTQADIDAGRVTYDHDGSNETADSFAFSLADGGEDGVQPVTGTFNFSITATNDAPTAVALENAVTTLPEDANTVTRTKIADVVVTDDGLGTNTLSLSGTDAALFEIDGTELFLVAGAGLDSGANPALDVTVSVDDVTVGNTPDATVNHTVTITEVNDAPTAVVLQNAETTIAEDANTASRKKIADIVVTDDVLGTNTLTVSGPDASLFEIVGNELFLIAGAGLDFETNPALDVTVSVDDVAVGSTPDAMVSHTVTITDANDAPTAVVLQNADTTLAEDASTVSRTKIADIVVTDDALGTNTLTVSGADASLFEIDGSELFLIAGATLDFETNPTLNATVSVDDVTVGNTPDAMANHTVAITDINEAPTAIALQDTVTKIAEDSNTVSRMKIADIVVTDDALGTNTLTVSGADASLFEIDGSELFLIAGVALDFETNPALDVTVSVDDVTVGNTPDAMASHTVTILDTNDAPTAVVLQNAVTTLAEDASTVSRTKIADIVVTDDALGINTLSVSGADAALFEIDGNELFLIAGAGLDFETNPSLDVTISGDDTSVGSTPDISVSHAVAVTNVNETPSIVIDPSGTLTVAEGVSNVAVVTGQDPDLDDIVTVSITGGDDAGLFELAPADPLTGTDPVTGTLAFTTPPVFNEGGDNNYEVVLTITDDEGLSSQVTVNVAVARFGLVPPTSASVFENQTMAIDLDAIVTPGDTAVFSIVDSGTADDGQLFDIDSATGLVTFKVAPDFESSSAVGGGNVYRFTAEVTDQTVGQPASQLISVTVQNVDEAPVFTIATPSDSSNEDPTPALVSVPGFASGISAIEPSQTASLDFVFTPTGTTGDLTFTQAPDVDPMTGTLTYQATADSNGTAIYDVVLTDNGTTDNGTTDNGGANQSSPAVSVTITVNAVNDAPTFIIAGNQTIDEDPIPATVTVTNFLTMESVGPANEVSQSIIDRTVNVISGASLFSVLPRIDAAGTLTYTPAANASGMASLSVTLSDDGGIARNGQNTSVPQAFTITINAVNDAPFVSTNTGLSVREEETRTIMMGQLETTDVDDGPAELLYTVSTLPTTGNLLLDGEMQSSSFTFTQQDINDGLLAYQHTNPEARTDSFTFTVSDGELNTTPQTFDIRVLTILAPISDQTFGSGLAPVTIPVSAAVIDGDIPQLISPDRPSFVDFTDNGNGTGFFTFHPQTSDESGSPYTITLQGVTMNSGTDEVQFDAVVVPGPTNVSNQPVAFVNVGGSGIPSARISGDTGSGATSIRNTGNVFSTGTTIDVGDESIPEGTPASIFQTQRWDGAGGPEMQFSFPVEPGEYQVNLFFAELYGPTSRTEARVFDVVAEGTTVIDNLDIFTEAGGGNKGLVRTFTVTADSTLDLAFLHQVENPIVSAIQIINLNQVPSQSAPRLSSIGNQTASEGQTLTIDFRAPDAQRDHVVLTHSALPSERFQFTDNGNGTGRLTIDAIEGDAGEYPITITATQENGVSLTDAESFVVSVLATNDPPQIATNDPLTLMEGATAIIGADLLSGSDLDNSTEELTYTLNAEPQHGRLQREGTILQMNESFSQADVTANLIQYVHDGGESTSDSFAFTLSDGAGRDVSDRFNINITPVNDSPKIDRSNNLTVLAGGTRRITVAQLSGSDPDDLPSGLTYTVTGPTDGMIFVNDNAIPFNGTGTFTQQDILDGLVEYRNTNDQATSDSFSVSLADGGEDGSTPATATIDISIDDVTILAPIPDQTIAAETGPVDIPVAAASVDGVAPALTVTGLPDFATFTDHGDGTGLFTFDPKSGDVGSSTIDLTATAGDVVETVSFTLNVVTVPTEQSNETIYFVNAGGPGIANPQISGDTGASSIRNTGTVFSTGATINLGDESIPDGTPASIFQTLRYDTAGGSEMNFSFPVDPGNYQVRLYFAETYGPAFRTGARVFDVAAEGVVRINDLDVFSEVGGNAGFVETIPSVTADSTLDITFLHQVENPIVSAIEIINLNQIPAQKAPVLPRIGNLSVNEGQTYTFSFADPGNLMAAFAPELPSFVTVSDSDGFVTVTASPSEGDAGQYPINGTVTQNGLTDSESIVLTVVGVNEPPELTINNPLTVDEGTNGVIDSSLLNSSDPDDSPSELSFSFTVTGGPEHGQLLLDGSLLSEGGSFTQANINENRVTYSHDGGEAPTDSFDFMLVDGREDGVDPVHSTFSINVLPINDAPTLNVNTGLTVREGATRVITSSRLDTSDVDNADVSLVYTLTSPDPTAGTVRVDGVQAPSFTQQDVNDGLVTYTQDGTVASTDSFGFSLSDGSASAVTGTVSINIAVEPAFELDVNAGGPA